MPVFSYTGRSKSGEKVEGTVDAPDRRVALQQLERMGHIPVSVVEQSAKAAKAAVVKRKGLVIGGTPRMRTGEVLLFTTELSDLLSSGMKLGNALNCLANRKTGRDSDVIIGDLRDEIVRGSSLSDALTRHPKTFPMLYSNMIKAGEASGALHEVLSRLVAYYEKAQELSGKVVMALVYPSIVLTMGVATLVFSMVFVVPKFKVIFDQLGGTLPLPTQILISTSEWLARFGWLLAVAIVGGVVLLNRFVQTRAGRMWWDGLKLRLPLIRGIVASSTFANFASTLGTLLDNGVSVLPALGIVEKTVGNLVIGRELQKARDRVTDGTTISGPLAASRVFPGIMTDMLAVGEQTGDMSGALRHIAKRYENELDRNVKIFTTALEPILIVVVAVLVGFVAISILMAVFNMTNGLNA